MKIPLYFLIVPQLRKNSHVLKKVCGYPFLNFANKYTCMFGILGALLNMFDIIKIIRCGPLLPNSLSDCKITASNIISPEGKRDIKLISLVLSFEYYVLLILAVVMNNPTLFMPWLLLYIGIMIMQFFCAFLRLFLHGLNFSKNNLIVSMLLVCNWLTVFCAFSRMLGACPYK